MSSELNKTWELALTIAISIFVILSISVLTFPNAHAANVTLAWDANTESDLAGYKLHYGTSTGIYPNSVDVGNVTTYTVPNLADGQSYYFAVTAYDNQRNESAYSNEVSYRPSTVVDSDGDGISDQDEINIYGTNPNAADTDQDGLNDGDEVTVHGTDPNSADTDADGLSDSAEINTYATNPKSTDSDQDGISDNDEINTYGTNPNAGDTDDDGIPDIDEINIHGTNPNLADSDQDGLSDAQEINTYATNPKLADSDQDGIGDKEEIHTYGTDPNLADTDGDGMNDGYEVNNGFNPLIDDDTVTPPTNSEPYQPVLLLPADGDTDLSLLPVLQTEAYSDPENDTHAATLWQISTKADFSYIVFNLKSSTYLTTLPVPEALLDTNTTYHWRVKFFDDRNAESEWADPFTFVTVPVSSDDLDQNGLLDNQEVDTNVDLDEDKTPDRLQPNIKSIKTVEGNNMIGVKASNNVRTIDALISLDPDMISEVTDRPADLPFGVISFRIQVDNPGDTAYVTVHLAEAAPAEAKWYKQDLANSWYDYSDYVTFSTNRKKITIQLIDGGIGDADGAVNGMILDPSGMAASETTSATSTSESSSASTSGGDGFNSCFISSATAGYPTKWSAGISGNVGRKVSAVVCLLILCFTGWAAATDRRRKTKTGA